MYALFRQFCKYIGKEVKKLKGTVINHNQVNQSSLQIIIHCPELMRNT